MKSIDLTRAILKHRRPYEIKPDFNRFLRAVLTCEPGQVPVGDIFADMETVGNYLGERVFDYSSMSADPLHRLTPRILLDGFRNIHQTIRFCVENDWDYAYSFSAIPFPGFTYDLAENTSDLVKDRKRSWVNDHRGPISTWEDFEKYPWAQDAGTINLMSRTMARSVPDGMKVMVIPGGVFEWTTWLMGLEHFCFCLADQPDLVDAVIDRVASTVRNVVEDLMDEENIGGIFMGDDLGFVSGTLVSPATLRKKFIPRSKEIIDLVHSAGKVFVMHSCGNMYAVMDDLIAAGIDAKHSFEDKILPVEAVYQKWGQRVGIIGGVDLHLLASGREDDIRRRTREILEVCAPGGHYVLGTGNSVANYIPLRNYRAMIDEGQRWNREHFHS
jgi:uroporphyrinogen decarboxylase